MRVGRRIKLGELETRQLWESYGIEDVVTLARGGSFGLYFRESIDSWSSTVKQPYSINYFIDVIKLRSVPLSLARTISLDPRLLHTAMYDTKESGAQLEQKLVQFCNDHPALLKLHWGYHRLATDREVEIFRSCDVGSVKYMDENRKIPGSGMPVYFGFYQSEGSCYSPCLLLPKQPISIHDLYVFEEQIIEYERKTKPKKENTRKGSKTRLNELIKETYLESDDISPKSIWEKLKKLADKGHEFIDEVDPWTSNDPKIHWACQYGHVKTIKKSTFQNFISKLQ